MTVVKIESNQQREKVGQDAKSDNQSTYPTINSHKCVDYAYTVVPSMPKTYEEAIHSQDAEKWKAAMDNEIKTLKENHAWDITPLPESRTETKGRWV